jgi:hypothetical protein
MNFVPHNYFKKHFENQAKFQDNLMNRMEDQILIFQSSVFINYYLALNINRLFRHYYFPPTVINRSFFFHYQTPLINHLSIDRQSIFYLLLMN